MSSKKKTRPVGETLERLVAVLRDARYELRNRSTPSAWAVSNRIDEELTALGVEGPELEWHKRRDRAVGDEEHAAAIDGAELLIVRLGDVWSMQIAIAEIDLEGVHDAAAAKIIAVPKAHARLREMASMLVR